MSTTETAAHQRIAARTPGLGPDPHLVLSATAPLGEPPTLFGTVRSAAAIAGALTLAVGIIGLVVGLAFPDTARDWLRFPFTGVPARPAEAVTIFLHNLRALTAIGGLLLISQSPFWGVSDAPPPRVHRCLRWLGEAVLGAAVAANAVVLGASIGGYGVRMIRAALPHGPVELAAYAVALALYREGRSRRLPMRHTLAVAGFSVLALVLAALLEAFVTV